MKCLGAVFLLVLAAVDCSKLPIDGRIVGGSVADIKKFPYQVSLRYSGQHICGGAIIDEHKIVTAAHCTIRFDPSELSVRAGSSIRNQGTLHQVYEIQQHPEFNEEYLMNDISKCLITPLFNFSDTEKPIKIATKRPADNRTVVMSGWGKTKETGSRITMELRSVAVHVINTENCRESYGKSAQGESMISYDNSLCAAPTGKDSCQGDSGGPLVDPYRNEMVGISSWGNGCAEEEYPGVYTNVASYTDFIQAN